MRTKNQSHYLNIWNLGGCEPDISQVPLVLNDFTTHAINPIGYDWLLLKMVNPVEVNTTSVDSPYPSLTDY